MIKPETDAFLKQYDNKVYDHAVMLRDVLLAKLPGIQEQLDVPAKMVAYSYGPKYADLICVIIPSKKGLKLGFNRGTTLADPDNLLQGTGKISRYIVIQSPEQITSAPVTKMLERAFVLYQQLKG